MTVSSTTHPSPFPTASKYIKKQKQTVIGPMLDVAQALIPRHEVKKYIHQKSQVGFLCWYGFERHISARSRHGCALKTPLTQRNGMLGNITTALEPGLQFMDGQSAIRDTMKTYKKKRRTHNFKRSHIL